tara:strand:+ start:223 stop:483 length:261 start_codon:yes stop_codon:yes gene_type:complete
MNDFVNGRKKFGGKGPKVKPRGGETKLKTSQNKAIFSKIKENKPDGRINITDIIRELNNRKGVELSTGLGKAGLEGLAKAINKKLD